MHIYKTFLSFFVIIIRSIQVT